jgi:hypothetical protein
MSNRSYYSLHTVQKKIRYQNRNIKMIKYVHILTQLTSIILLFQMLENSLGLTMHHQANIYKNLKMLLHII